MRRWHSELHITTREWRKHYLSHVKSNLSWNRNVGQDPYVIDCVCDEQRGRFRKKDAWDCGNTRCGICHNDKFPKRELTRKEEKALKEYREQTEEFFESR